MSLGSLGNAFFNTSLSSSGSSLTHGSDMANAVFGVAWSIFWPVVGGKLVTPRVIKREKERIRKEAEEAKRGEGNARVQIKEAPV